MQPDFGDRPRCFQPDLKPSSPCSKEFVLNPDSEMDTTKNESLTLKKDKRSSLVNEKLVQISPQEVKLKLRISEFL
jgi:hypothetical protein